ncbi:MAG: hypothetical protein B0A82_19265 [Alkalinema sp. CACIAM 70d]|nr:MAG: hypothetical protein B0A82_19265 [Alkalinema sp. CACIAM 70d]
MKEVTNGSEFLFLKVSRTPIAQYATSRLFSLLNPGNELWTVLSILKTLAQPIAQASSQS